MFLQDLRYAVRTLIKNRGFTAVAVACLALGIGVNAAIFSLFDGVVLQPYPYPDASRIVVFRGVNPRLHISRGSMTYLDYKDIRESTKSFAALEAFDYRSLTIDDRFGEPERYRGSAISHGLFDLLGAAPVLGRSFRAEDDRPGAEPVVLLSDDVWARRYNRDRAVIGRAINVSGHPATIIGVMPPRFAFPETQQLWLPLAMYSPGMTRSNRGMQVFGAPAGCVDRSGAERRCGRRVQARCRVPEGRPGLVRCRAPAARMDAPRAGRAHALYHDVRGHAGPAHCVFQRGEPAAGPRIGPSP